MSKEQITDVNNSHCRGKTDKDCLPAIAIERISHYDPSTLISSEEVDYRLGLTEDDLVGWEDVEIE